MRKHKRQDRWDPDEVSNGRNNWADGIHNEHASEKETQEVCLPFYLELILMSPFMGDSTAFFARCWN